MLRSQVLSALKSRGPHSFTHQVTRSSIEPVLEDKKLWGQFDIFIRGKFICHHETIFLFLSSSPLWAMSSFLSLTAPSLIPARHTTNYFRLTGFIIFLLQPMCNQTVQLVLGFSNFIIWDHYARGPSFQLLLPHFGLQRTYKDSREMFMLPNESVLTLVAGSWEIKIGGWLVFSFLSRSLTQFEFPKMVRRKIEVDAFFPTGDHISLARTSH